MIRRCIYSVIAFALAWLSIADSTEAGRTANDITSGSRLKCAVNIVYRPVSFGKRRQAFTLEYIRTHYDPTAESIEIVPRVIVVHFTGSASLRSAFETFRPDTISLLRWRLRKAGRVNVSAQFLVDRDGTIYQLMPENWMARHTIGLNRISVGIENVGAPRSPLTARQLEADAELIRCLRNRFPSIEYLIGHYEYLEFRNTPLWQELNKEYVTRKIDPGKTFMDQLRARVADLRLRDSYSSE